VQGKERLLKKRSPQHNKPTNPNNEVPPQDAQLQGVEQMAPKHNSKIDTSTQTKASKGKCATQDECKIKHPRAS